MLDQNEYFVLYLTNHEKTA